MGFADDINYYFKDGKAYTEDNVVVFNVFFYKLPRNISRDRVEKYFKRFGTVHRVHLITEKHRRKKSGPRVGFVNFADCVAAAHVLATNNHIIDGKRFLVKACDSWHQPDVNGHETNENTGEADQYNHLLELNDDCLVNICKHLDLSDQIQFSRVCERLRDIFGLSCKMTYTNFRVDKLNGLTLWDIREFFATIGPNIDTFYGCIPFKDRDRILELMGSLCPNVKHLQFHSIKMRSKCLRKLLTKMTEVIDIRLRTCSLNDNAVFALRSSDKLEILDLSENFEITGKHLSGLHVGLKELNLFGCSNIQAVYFSEMCHVLKDIKSLNIQRCDRIHATAFIEMCYSLQKLEVLKFSSLDVQYELVTRLPNLKHLEILVTSPTRGLRNQLFEDLATYAGDRMEYLKIVGRNCLNSERAPHLARLTNLKTLICANNDQANNECLRQLCALENLENLAVKNARVITNTGLIDLLRSCEKLRRLNIQMCASINDHFIFEAIKVLNKRKEHTHQLQIFVTNTLIHESILANCLYLEAEKNGLLKVHFHVPLTMGIEVDEMVEIFNIWDLDDFDFDEDEEDDDDAFDNDDDIYFPYDYSDDEDQYNAMFDPDDFYVYYPGDFRAD